MKLVDTNVLLNAAFEDQEFHSSSVRWLEQALRGREPLAIPWTVVVGFVRIATLPSVFPSPMTPEEALDFAAACLSRPQVISADPSRGHLQGLRSLLLSTGRAGNLTNDAHLAALALEHRATVVSYDTDFGRFPGLTWRTPEQLLQGRQ